MDWNLGTEKNGVMIGFRSNMFTTKNSIMGIAITTKQKPAQKNCFTVMCFFKRLTALKANINTGKMMITVEYAYIESAKTEALAQNKTVLFLSAATLNKYTAINKTAGSTETGDGSMYRKQDT